MDNIMKHASPSETDQSPDDTDLGKHAKPRRRTPRRWLRVLLPALLIIAWVTGAAVGGPYFGKVNEVSTNDQTTFLPESAEATQVQELQDEFTDNDGIPAIALFESDEELTEDQLTDIESALDDAVDLDGIEDEVSPPIPSDDGMAVQAFIPIDADAETSEIVSVLSDDLRRLPRMVRRCT